jgi:hypothetical protein
MDLECAFCGRSLDAQCHVYCDDCQQTHTVCPTCADDVAADTEGYRLVA